MYNEKAIWFAILCMVLGAHGEITNARQCINLISAYNEFSTNGNVGVKATMVSRCGPMVKTNDMIMVFCHTNSEWRMTYWDVDE